MIEIGEKKQKITSAYKITLYFMSGDADSYQTEELLIPADHKDLPDFCEFLLNCLKVGSKRKYSHIKNFDRFTEEENDNRESFDSKIWPVESNLGLFDTFGWPYDVFTSDVPARLESVTVEYFDERGDEFDAKLKYDV